MRQPVNILGGFYRDANRHWTDQDCLNWIPVRAEKGGSRTEWQLRDAPGVYPYARIMRDVGTEMEREEGAIRGMRNVEGKLFVVAGTGLYQISNTGVAIRYGTIPGVTRVSMSHNQRGGGNELLVVNGSSGYVFNTAALVFQKITDPGYPGAFIADYVDQYLAQVEPQGRYWFHSDLADALNYNTLDQYEAEGDPDRIVSLLVNHREVLLFGRITIEPYVNTGGQTGTFERASNTVIQSGCSARFSTKNVGENAVYLDDKRVVQVLNGYTPMPISHVGIEQALRECSEAEISTAYAMSFNSEGHNIYYLTVPGRFTFGYDFKYSEWHRRATFGADYWCITDAVYWNGQWIAGDSRHGRLYILDWDYKRDVADELVRERVSGYLSDNQNHITCNELELLFDVGGKESVAPDPLFPAQPEGPQISGDAPNATIGQEGYSYAYTLTAGDSDIVKAFLSSGAIPAGFSLSDSGVLTGNAGMDIAEYSFTVRVVDKNGLIDDVADSISIGLEGATPIPVTTTTLFSISGGGAFDIAQEQVDASFPEITDTHSPWAKIVCVSFNGGSGVSPETRTYIYDQEIETFYDSQWRGNPANQSAMTAALATAGLSAYGGTIIAPDSIHEWNGYDDSYLTWSEPFELADDFASYSGRRVIYRSTAYLNSVTYLQRPSAAQIPAGATKLDAYPGYYIGSDSTLYVCDWGDP